MRQIREPRPAVRDEVDSPAAGVSRGPLVIEPIGVIRTPFPAPAGAPIQPSRAGGARGQALVFERFRQGLQDLAGFERVWLIHWLHQAPPPRLLVTPFLDAQPRGIFATRAPARPAPIGISAVRLLGIDDGILELADVDIVDGAPLLDIKPYVPEFDCYPGTRAGWFDESTSDRRVADHRFARHSGESPDDCINGPRKT
ncbi:MAG: tRNA (N6-threonylcarbamoyladenosine(37)-N6)-methyltransferase TrmO [Bryobacteraceae bacterium]|nr:tRNA (N6-threonylcarbamoyladenosine(37)-N6)-methyltransferase TrmO [Bryobacteraceae bacterium]